MASSRVGKNVASALFLQVTSVVCAFILPRLILVNFGSKYSGIISSVSQFLSCVTLLRAGIGGVTRAALYKSLAAKDHAKTSAIITATQIFMRKLAVIFVGFLLVFAMVYPFFVKESFDWLFSFTLILILGISTVVQYCFGITNQILLHADQRLYLHNYLQAFAVILNTLLTVLLVYLGCGIHVAKLGSAVAFSISPIVMHLYVKKNYSLDYKATPDNGAITQRWDAVAHQISAFVHTNSALMVLTIFADLLQVAVYSVYNLIVNGINQVIMVCATAIESFLGKVLAQNDANQLNENVNTYEWTVHILGTVLYSCAAILIIPFVMIYTESVTDVNYNQPILGIMMSFSAFLACIRLPYQNTIEAAGHFKQTKMDAIIEACLNVSVSVLLVIKLGTIGVVAGAIVAMLYRTIRYAIYASKHILHRPLSAFLKRCATSAICIAEIALLYFLVGAGKYLLLVASYPQWIVAACITVICTTTVVLLTNLLFFPKLTMKILTSFLRKLVKK